MFKLAQNIINKMDSGMIAFKKFQPMQTANVAQKTQQTAATVSNVKNSFGLSSGESWLLDNIARVESGGKRNALGIPVGGDRAHGYFQFMGNTLKNKGYNKSTNEFLNNTKDQIDMGKSFMYDLVKASGNKINTTNPTTKDLQMLYAGWYSGPGVYKNMGNAAYMNQAQYASGVRMPSRAQSYAAIGKNTTPFSSNYQMRFVK